jgi:outer membrane protein, heavy metal efflux system
MVPQKKLHEAMEYVSFNQGGSSGSLQEHFIDQEATMTVPDIKQVLLFWILLSATFSGVAHAQTGDASAALSLADVKQIARTQRAEIQAARAGARAASERAIVVSSLEDPMLMPAIDHYPNRVMNGMSPIPMTGRFSWSMTVEQRFPLSGVRGYRRQSAEAEARGMLADSDRLALDVEWQAAEAYFMLMERRRMLLLNEEQMGLAEQMVQAASARFSTGTGNQTDLLRAEVETARLRGANQALRAEVRGMEAMLNATLGRRTDTPIPVLANRIDDSEPPPVAMIIESALASRPELQTGTAEIARAGAEVDVMRSMYRPMAVVRVGPASDMVMGQGGMVMVGISVPIWGNKLRAGVAEANAMLQMARADYTAMQRMVEGDAANARELVAASRESYLALRDEVVPRARQAQEPALAAYASGTGSMAAVIDAAQAQWAAEIELLMMEIDLGLAWAKLQRAIGQ